jgi:hypothetical protein
MKVNFRKHALSIALGAALIIPAIPVNAAMSQDEDRQEQGRDRDRNRTQDRDRRNEDYHELKVLQAGDKGRRP